MNKFIDFYYKIRRFIINIKFWPKETKYIYQRIRYGVSEKDCWSLDYYLCKVIVKGLDELIKNNHGCPHEFFDNSKEAEGNECWKWANTLKQMRKGFKAGFEILTEDYIFDENDKLKTEEERDKLYKGLEKDFDEGFTLFKKYFFNLWD